MQCGRIGTIHTPFSSREECPIQPVYARDSVGTVELDEAYAEGLKDIETFSHLILLYLFDRAGEVHLIRPPFLDDRPHGVFATRHPCRPNPLGLSVVRLVERTAARLVVAGVDMLDRSPLLDIKPYIPRFDRIDTAVNGWVEEMPWRPKPPGRE